MPPDSAFALIRRREVLFPTLRGWLVVTAVVLISAVTSFFLIHPFLSLNQPRGNGILVAEGWLPEYGIRKALEIFRAGGYSRLVVTGGPLPPGVACSSYGTYAELSARLIMDMGLGKDSLAMVPSPSVTRDRTYAEGLALAAWMDSSAQSFPSSVDVVSFSTHSRRSRLLYAKALGTRSEVGVLSVDDALYDPRRWWKSSQGVKSVMVEGISYIYTRFLFRP